MKANKRGNWTINKDKLYRERKMIIGEIRRLIDKRDTMDKLIAEIEAKQYSARKFIAEEIVRFLLDTGYVEAAEAVAKEYEI